MVTFAVPGKPVPQGSLTSFRHATTGKVVTPQKASVREYRDRIAWAARQTGMACTDEPVAVDLRFYFARPKSHYRPTGQLREKAPRWHCQRPDGDKLARAALDALTGVMLYDDAQVWQLTATKVWATEDSTRVTVTPVAALSPEQCAIQQAAGR